jgi:hypothetical protein
MTHHLNEALAAELAYRRERLMPPPRITGERRHRWTPRRHRPEG